MIVFLVDRQTAVAADDLSGHIGGQVAGQEERHVRHVGVEAAAVQRDLLHPLFAHLFGELLRHRGLDEARSHGVAADAARTEFLGDGTREADDTGFRGGVVARSGQRSS